MYLGNMMETTKVNGSKSENMIHSHVIDEYLSGYIESDHFNHKIVSYTQKTCHDIMSMVIKPLAVVGIPLCLAIIGLVLYIFFSLQETVKELSHTTSQLEKTIGLFDERTKNNQDAIRVLLNKRHHREG